MTYEQTKEVMIEIRTIIYESLELSLSHEPRDWAKALAGYIAVGSKIQTAMPGLLMYTKRNQELLKIHEEISAAINRFDVWRRHLKNYLDTSSKDTSNLN
jgi:hypothetical protein